MTSERDTIIREEAKADRYYESIGSREECPQSMSGRHQIDPAMLTFDRRNGIEVVCHHCGCVSGIDIELLIDAISDAVDWPS
jgi:hypothetical protein